MQYQLFDPSPHRFPPPRLPLLAPLSWDAIHCWRDPQAPVPAWQPSKQQRPRLYSRARYALRDAYQLSGVGPNGALLAPSYHCRTMLDPALQLGAPVQLYALQANLQADLADIARQLVAAPTPIKAVLAPHYFGLPQDLRALAALCAKHDAELIEDCAHALPLRQPGNGMGNGMGTTGTWCVASPYKFFPCEDGGALWSGSGQPLPPLMPLSKLNLRGELRQWRRLRARSRRPKLELVQTGPSAPAEDPHFIGRASCVNLQGSSPDYHPAQQSSACSMLSRWIIGHANIDRIVTRRRDHYQSWAREVQTLANASALFPALGVGATPYMFPLLLDQPHKHFAALKHAGLPIWRWDSLAQSHCPTAADYRLRLLQLPCHQALSEADLAWMFATLRTILGSKASGAAA